MSDKILQESEYEELEQPEEAEEVPPYGINIQMPKDNYDPDPNLSYEQNPLVASAEPEGEGEENENPLTNEDDEEYYPSQAKQSDLENKMGPVTDEEK